MDGNERASESVLNVYATGMNIIQLHIPRMYTCCWITNYDSVGGGGGGDGSDYDGCGCGCGTVIIIGGWLPLLLAAT